MQNIQIQPDKQNDVHCDDDGTTSRTVWGYINVDGAARAVYYVQWTLGQPAENGANIDLLMGEWGDGTTPEQRVALSLVLEINDGPLFYSIDPDGRPHAATGLAAHLIPAQNVFANPVGADAYAFMHAIFGQDPRVREIVDAVVASR